MRNSVHMLKIKGFHIDQYELGIKSFEYRKDDRGFSVGDRLIMTEVDARFPRVVFADITNITYCGDVNKNDDYLILQLNNISVFLGLVSSKECEE